MTCNASFSLINHTLEEEHHRFHRRTVQVLQLISLSLTFFFLTGNKNKAGVCTRDNVNTAPALSTKEQVEQIKHTNEKNTSIISIINNFIIKRKKKSIYILVLSITLK